MALLQTAVSHVNIFAQCRKLGVPLWSCPQFLFVVMGAINIAAVLSVYTIAQKYSSPEFIILIVVSLSIFLFVVSFTIIGAFEQVVMARQREALRHHELLTLKDQFVFVAAHELRSPVSDISFGLSTLLESGAIKKAHDVALLERIRAKNATLAELLNDLLNVAWFRGEEQMYTLVKIPLDTFFKEIADEVSPMAQKQGIKITFPTALSLPSVLAHPRSLKEVLINLITNAVRYSRKDGWVLVEIEQGPREVTIHVKDNGIGIDEANIGKLFTQFYRIRDKDTRNIDGTGLGLFIAKELVRRMRGNIWVKSVKGEGSTFSFSVPLYATS
ncbi:MAG: two component system sensor histidine kinase [Parcubacteria group bacterium Gr01-1014_48]|nr:MAG: two component system sensor histidine kinase [Parcubacteria group bacterium Greene0416_14]TSC73487.1 MAG: two component system sensor histidine kinase [Parcubacteria group bacterium Gr01-1014_48]TSD01220.1 MAG: two component system sensor histidine kinase [Parcubacteria group bacterium Greene1014_15]TSD08315.1 MAG: two component system sensor histidine kinase [Parcubacteria group bacterium Greene0714_4]